MDLPCFQVAILMKNACALDPENNQTKTHSHSQLPGFAKIRANGSSK